MKLLSLIRGSRSTPRPSSGGSATNGKGSPDGPSTDQLVSELRAWAETALQTVAEIIDELQETCSTLTARMEATDSDLTEVKLAVDDGIRHVDRAERRIRATVKRAREQLSEHGLESAGLEAEAAELRVIDGGGSEPEGVQPVPEDMGRSAQAALRQVFDGIPGEFDFSDLEGFG